MLGFIQRLFIPTARNLGQKDCIIQHLPLDPISSF
jgi:hypothetical protein